MKPTALLACSVFTLIGLPALAQAQPAPLSPGRQILSACAATYKSLREFRGASSVISQSSVQVDKNTPQMSLRITDARFDFVRDGHFNIAGHDTDHYPFNITSTPLRTTSTWQYGDKQKTEGDENIEMAVGGMTGVAADAPTVVPALLLESGWGFPFFIRSEATIKGSEMFGGHECYVVVQKEKRVYLTTTLWIDSKTFLLRGMREERSEHSFSAQEPKVLFGNTMHVFSIETTVPGEAELATAAKKTINFPAPQAATKVN